MFNFLPLIFMSQNSSKYGEQHRVERAKKLISMEEQKCQLTDMPTQPLEAHHVVNRLFNGPDLASNYAMLSNNVHQNVLHPICNVHEPQMVGERVRLTKALVHYILDDEKREKIHDQIRAIDKVLISEFINNLMNKLPHHFRERMIEITTISNYETIRDLNIENMKLKKQLEAIPQ